MIRQRTVNIGVVSAILYSSRRVEPYLALDRGGVDYTTDRSGRAFKCVRTHDVPIGINTHFAPPS